MPAVKATVSAKALMGLLEVSKSAVFAWKDAGCPHRKGPKGFEFVVADVVAWLEQRAERKGRDSAVQESNYQEKLKWDAEHRRLQVEQLRGDLVPADLVRQEYERFVGGFAAVASGRLQTFERDIVQTMSPGDARRLTSRIHAALMEGAQEFANQIADTPDDDDESPEAAA